MREELYTEIFNMEQQHWWFSARHQIILHLLERYLPAMSGAPAKVAESEQLWNRLSENGIRKTRASYSTDTAGKKLEFLFGEDHLKSLDRSTETRQSEIMSAAKS
jgi:hypothetical protein